VSQTVPAAAADGLMNAANWANEAADDTCWLLIPPGPSDFFDI
jgi:hypothetical protein